VTADAAARPALAAVLASGEPERLYTGLSLLVSTAADGRSAEALATFRALALLLDPDLAGRAQLPGEAPSLSAAGRAAFGTSLEELRALAFELESATLYACSASVETMGLSPAAVERFDGVLSTPRFLRRVEGAALVFV
jgi:peroxiredoxin family protein